MVAPDEAFILCRNEPPPQDHGRDQLQSHRDAAHRAWEAERKLRKRVETLERRLDERGVELQAAESQATQARDQLARWVRETRERAKTVDVRFFREEELMSARRVSSRRMIPMTYS